MFNVSIWYVVHQETVDGNQIAWQIYILNDNFSLMEHGGPTEPKPFA